MKVFRAEHAGACYGVQRALDIAFDVLACQGSAVSLGPLIHNPNVVADLERKGIDVVDDFDEVGNRTVIIRSHGVTPNVMDALRARSADIADATCPHVARAQKAAAELAQSGCHVLVVGEAGHPEVEGLRAHAAAWGASVDVVLTADQIPYGICNPVGVVVQTTQTAENLASVVAALEERGINPLVKDTICSATQRRQAAAAELSRNVDAMVVIGGRNSSNTTRLAEICSELCPHTFHIESADELTKLDFSSFGTVGVTAGASTPEDQIEQVERFLQEQA